MEHVVDYFNVISQYLSERSNESYVKPHSGSLVSFFDEIRNRYI